MFASLFSLLSTSDVVSELGLHCTPRSWPYVIRFSCCNDQAENIAFACTCGTEPSGFGFLDCGPVGVPPCLL